MKKSLLSREERRRIIAKISRLARDSDFRRRLPLHTIASALLPAFSYGWLRPPTFCPSGPKAVPTR